MATITRAPVTITALDVLGWSMTRAGRSVVHPILGDGEPDVTSRVPALRAGALKCLFPTEPEAQACADALAVVGGAWVFAAGTVTMTARVVGDITVDAVDDAGTSWTVTAAVHEVTA